MGKSDLLQSLELSTKNDTLLLKYFNKLAYKNLYIRQLFIIPIKDLDLSKYIDIKEDTIYGLKLGDIVLVDIDRYESIFNQRAFILSIKDLKFKFIEPEDLLYPALDWGNHNLNTINLIQNENIYKLQTYKSNETNYIFTTIDSKQIYNYFPYNLSPEPLIYILTIPYIDLYTDENDKDSFENFKKHHNIKFILNDTNIEDIFNNIYEYDNKYINIYIKEIDFDMNNKEHKYYYKKYIISKDDLTPDKNIEDINTKNIITSAREILLNTTSDRVNTLKRSVINTSKKDIIDILSEKLDKDYTYKYEIIIL